MGCLQPCAWTTTGLPLRLRLPPSAQLCYCNSCSPILVKRALFSKTFIMFAIAFNESSLSLSVSGTGGVIGHKALCPMTRGRQRNHCTENRAAVSAHAPRVAHSGRVGFILQGELRVAGVNSAATNQPVPTSLATNLYQPACSFTAHVRAHASPRAAWRSAAPAARPPSPPPSPQCSALPRDLLSGCLPQQGSDRSAAEPSEKQRW